MYSPANFGSLVSSTSSVVVLGSVTLFLLGKSRFGKKALPLPPGPPGLPIIGNALQIPAERQWLTFTDWAKSYGEIVHVSAFGQSLIILNSPKAVADLLDRRSSIYSDRPQFVFAGDLVGYSYSVPLCKYGDRHREYRKLLSEVLSPRAVAEWRSMEEAQMQVFLRDILQTPDLFLHHIRSAAARIVFDISHGYTLAKEDDPLMRLAEQADHDFAEATLPGRYLCDTLPILRFIPDWLGIEFKQDAKKFRKTMEALRDVPYDMVKQDIAQGTAKPSFTASLIERNPRPSREEELIYKWVSTGLYSGGADTSVSAISSFFLALSSHVDVQKKAQEELDRVVGRDRLPSFQDRPKLPYLEAVLKEVHRWNPVGPIALPHRSTQDDVYNGFHIPSGSIVFANSWGILHDASLYPSPDEFNPERFLANSDAPDTNLNPDPRRFAFGYGRRVCPGRDLADDMLFICAAMTLAVFDLRREESTFEYTPAIISHPKPFKCAITPRSKEAVSLVTSDGL